MIRKSGLPVAGDPTRGSITVSSVPLKVVCPFVGSCRGSLELVPGVVVREEICREFQNGQLATAFLTNLFAGFFNSKVAPAPEYRGFPQAFLFRQQVSFGDSYR